MQKGNSISHLMKRWLFAGVFVLVAFSYAQLQFNIVQLTPLEGYMEVSGKPEWSLQSWLNGSYQKQAEKYVNQHIGFRPLLIRLRNQLMFWMFHETSSHIVIGKEDFLYEKNYIEAYLGRDFLGKDSIDRMVFQLRRIQDTLETMDIDFTMILAAGKASYYPEYIPDRFEPQHKSISNYEYFKQKFIEKGVHFIDFNAWFTGMKESARYPLYPKFGIHWSRYAQTLVTDSVIRYIENKKGITMPFIQWGPVEMCDTAREEDYDMGGAMNLLYKLKGFPLAYRKFRTLGDSSDVKPNVIVIGDSYYSSLFSNYLSKNVFSRSQFWFYNKQIYTTDQIQPFPIETINPQLEIEKQDAVFILSTEANLNRFGFGAIEILYNAYYHPREYYNAFVRRKDRVEFFKSKIMESPEWMMEVEQKAIERNISLEKMIQIDAEYMTDLEEQEDQRASGRR